MELAEQIVHPFGIDPLAVSRLFMHEDLAKSGLVLTDFPIPPVPVAAVGGRGCYQIWYDATYYKLKIDREHDKYIGIKGVQPPVVVLGDPYGAPITASVEGLKKALAFHVTTGIPTLAIDSCWGFGENVEENNGIKVKDLHTDIMQHLTPGQSHLVLFDGDWATNDNVRLALATYRMLLEEQGVKLKFKDIGTGQHGQKLGYDDWFVECYGTDRALWPTQSAVLEQVIVSLKDIPNEELLGGAQSFALNSPMRFSKEYLDLTDRGAGSLMVKLVGVDNFKFCKDTQEWIQWDAKTLRWVNLGSSPYGMIDIAAQHYLRRAQVLSAQAAKMEGNKELEGKMKGLLQQAKEFAKFGKGHCSSTAGRGAVLRDLESRKELWVFKDEFDSNPDLLAVANGVVELRTGTLRAERQSDLVLRRCPDDYVSEEPTGDDVDRLKQFLVEITGSAHGDPDPQALEYLQRRLGASVRGKNSLTAIELWNGHGSNGKSVLSNLLQAALGDTDKGGYACSTNANVIMSTVKVRDAESSTPFLVKLIGARLVFMAESKDTDHMNESFVKQISGGDKITARANYQEGKSYGVTFSPVLLTNNLPHINEGGEALWDRIAVTEFACRWRRPNKQYVSAEDLALPLGDLWFEDVAPHSKSVRQWLIWWLVEGCVKWFKEGLGAVPERYHTAVRAYQDNNDKYSDWMAECGWYFVDKDINTLSGELYRSFEAYTESIGGKAPINKIFTKRLLERFPQLSVKRSNGRNVVCGIALKERMEK
jgi:P4 family phage/plasmid primase-like protien